MILLKGMLLGLSIAAPVGPIGILCIRRTLQQGRAFGFVSGLGAATADAIYGSIAALGLTAVTHFLVRQSLWLHLFGALFLIYLAYTTFKSRLNQAGGPEPSKMGFAKTFGTTLLLTLTNPMTIVSFIGIMAGMNIGVNTGSTAWFVIGVFAGSALWWLLLSGVVGFFKRMISVQMMRWIQSGSGLVLLGFGMNSAYEFYIGL